MANIFEGVFHMVQGLFQSILAVLQAFFNVIYAIVSGVITLVWSVVESLAAFVGASAQFVASNIIILGVLVLGYVIYQDRAQRVRGERRENRVKKGLKVQ